MNILVIDIGGTWTKYACMQEDMTILKKGKLPTPQDGREDLIELIGSLYDSMTDVSGIAISMPGIIDADQGYCAMGGALRYNDGFYMKQRLFARCPTKIHLENDAKCAAMAESAVGSLKDVQDGFILLFGTMIGGGYIKDKKLHRGRHFSAGEVSYIITDKDGTPDYDTVWGNRCGTPRLCQMYANRKNLDFHSVNGHIVFDAIHQNDPDAVDCLDQFTKEIAVQIFNIQMLLDPERFAIGGGISAQPIFIEYIKKNLDQLYAQCPYPVPQADVVGCQFHNDANLIGALQCFLADEL